jgi:uncharacterized protein
MSLKPWREVAKPHKDVLEGTFKESEFAADISLVAAGKAPSEYQDPEMFFSRTFITEGMKLLLISVAQRLTGQGGDPVIQLQTAFGGGKTHTMLAVYHMASRAVSSDKLAGIAPLLEQAGIQELPHANVAVIDGIKLSPSQPLQHGNITVNTLWGELAWQLLGEEGFEMVKASDTDGTSPGKEVLTALFQKAAPCVVLIDELVAFIRQMESGKQYKSGTFDSNLSFIQALTESMKAVPNAILLASLPESEMEIGGTMGQRALNSLEKYFGRIESVWKPVATEEAFEIVRRRLFEYAGERSEIDNISRQFVDYYHTHESKFPEETQSGTYLDRLSSCYPIHPEVFDRLYEDWSSLDKFQRTRGVLQYMAVVINELWKSGNTDALIMPGSIQLDDPKVRTMSIRYLPPGWDPIIEKEVDGPKSLAVSIDNKDTRFGSIQAARRVTRTIFLGSAPGDIGQSARGIKTEGILLGVAQPGQTPGIFEDVTRRLRDAGTYLYSDQDRCWFDTKPNLRREMESRKNAISELEEVIPLLKDRLVKILGGRHLFSGTHVFTPTQDIPDDIGMGPRLVVLHPDSGSAYSKGDNNRAYITALDYLNNRGNQPRIYKNRLIFLAPDFDALGRLRNQGKVFLAWKSIVNDIEDGTLNQDIASLNQAKRNRDTAEQSLNQNVRETYKWIIVPSEEINGKKPEINWESVSISTTTDFTKSIENKLKEEEWLISEWAPIHLNNLLKKWYFKLDVKEINTARVWKDTCQYLYMPRLLNDQVFKDVVSKAITSGEYFGLAAGKEDDEYREFTIGKDAIVSIDDTSLLISHELAVAYLAKLKKKEEATDDDGGEDTVDGDGEDTVGGGSEDPIPPVDPSIKVAQKTRFYGTVDLDPVKATMDFSTIVQEVVQNFTVLNGSSVKISIEIEATNENGFDENLQRSVRENSGMLNFKSAEFDEE